MFGGCIAKEKDEGARSKKEGGAGRIRADLREQEGERSGTRIAASGKGRRRN
jgi:hypothetical protein